MTLKAFKKCDAKYDWYAYIRIGLYFVMRTGQRTNFCDVHLPFLPTEPLDLGYFSGPTDAMNDITRLARSQEASKRFRVEHKVNSDLTLTNGGVAKLVHSKKRNSMDVWLFGPLLFSDLPYGALVAELKELTLGRSGHKFTPVDPATGQERDASDPKGQRYLINFPKNYGLHYHPCHLLGSKYADGLHPSAPGRDYIIQDGGSTVHWEDGHGPGEKDYVPPGPAPDLIDALRTARQDLSAAVLPRDAVRVEWKIEDFAGDQTVCQIYQRSG